MVCIADTGFIVAINSSHEKERQWARTHLERHGPPFYTCESALAEATHLINPITVAAYVQRGIFVIRFDVTEQIDVLAALMRKYPERMDLADACIVRMSELFPTCEVFTVDKTDFQIYRRFGNKPIPAVFPE